MRDEKGFSMIELVVVVAMIAALTAMVVPNMSLKYSTEAKSCARKMDEMIGKCRIRQMSRDGECKIVFKTETDGVYGYYFEDGDYVNPREKEKLGGKVIKLKNKSGGAVSSVEITFDRSTGKLLTLTGVAAVDGVYTIVVDSRTKVYNVEIVALTGSHKVTE